MSAMDEFGKIFIEETRDVSIENVNQMIDGTMRGDSAKEIVYSKRFKM